MVAAVVGAAVVVAAVGASAAAVGVAVDGVAAAVRAAAVTIVVVAAAVAAVAIASAESSAHGRSPRLPVTNESAGEPERDALALFPAHGRVFGAGATRANSGVSVMTRPARLAISA